MKRDFKCFSCGEDVVSDKELSEYKEVLCLKCSKEADSRREQKEAKLERGYQEFLTNRYIRLNKFVEEISIPLMKEEIYLEKEYTLLDIERFAHIYTAWRGNQRGALEYFRFLHNMAQRREKDDK